MSDDDKLWRILSDLLDGQCWVDKDATLALLAAERERTAELIEAGRYLHSITGKVDTTYAQTAQRLDEARAGMSAAIDAIEKARKK